MCVRILQHKLLQIGWIFFLIVLFFVVSLSQQPQHKSCLPPSLNSIELCCSCKDKLNLAAFAKKERKEKRKRKAQTQSQVRLWKGGESERASESELLVWRKKVFVALLNLTTPTYPRPHSQSKFIDNKNVTKKKHGKFFLIIFIAKETKKKQNWPANEKQEEEEDMYIPAYVLASVCVCVGVGVGVCVLLCVR